MLDILDLIGLHRISKLKSIGQVSDCLKRGVLKLLWRA